MVYMDIGNLPLIFMKVSQTYSSKLAEPKLSKFYYKTLSPNAEERLGLKKPTNFDTKTSDESHVSNRMSNLMPVL